MSQLLTQFKLDYGKYFDQPPDPRESTPSTADPDNIFNFSNQLREDLQPTNGLAPKTTNPNSDKVSDIVSDIKDKAMKSTNESKFEGAEIGGGMEQTDDRSKKQLNQFQILSLKDLDLQKQFLK